MHNQMIRFSVVGKEVAQNNKIELIKLYRSIFGSDTLKDAKEFVESLLEQGTKLSVYGVDDNQLEPHIIDDFKECGVEPVLMIDLPLTTCCGKKSPAINPMVIIEDHLRDASHAALDAGRYEIVKNIAEILYKIGNVNRYSTIDSAPVLDDEDLF